MSHASSDAGLERLRKEAKLWLKAIRGGDAEALARLTRVFPGHSAQPGLREVQQALAREHGQPSWAALKSQRQEQTLTREDDAQLHAELLRHACLSYGDDDWPAKWRRAERIRALRPSLACFSLHAAVVCGELEHVRALLAADATRVGERGGPQGWEPLLFACYGRLPNPQAQGRSLEIARLLLDHGADPNACFVMGDHDYRFSALTGALGQGELGQPEHPHATALAELLLERGASPNDGQALYNTHFEGDTRWLDVLGQHGLDANARANWDFGDQPPRLLDYLLVAAAKNGHEARARWLLAHGADPDAVSTYDGKSCLHTALVSGRHELAQLLRAHGAHDRPLEPRDAFLAACMRGDRAEAARLLEGHREYLDDIEPLIAAAREGQRERTELLLELGMDPNASGKHGHRPLHAANKHPELVQLLLRHGADPRARCFGGTLSSWARFDGGDLPLARLHAETTRLLLDAVGSGHLALATTLLAEDPACLNERSPGGNTALHELPDDAALAEPLIELLLAHGADPDARNREGQTPAQTLIARGLDPIADLLEAAADAKPSD